MPLSAIVNYCYGLKINYRAAVWCLHELCCPCPRVSRSASIRNRWGALKIFFIMMKIIIIIIILINYYYYYYYY